MDPFFNENSHYLKMGVEWGRNWLLVCFLKSACLIIKIFWRVLDIQKNSKVLHIGLVEVDAEWVQKLFFSFFLEISLISFQIFCMYLQGPVHSKALCIFFGINFVANSTKLGLKTTFVTKDQEYSKSSLGLLLLKFRPALNQGKLTKPGSKSGLCNLFKKSRGRWILKNAEDFFFFFENFICVELRHKQKNGSKITPLLFSRDLFIRFYLTLMAIVLQKILFNTKSGQIWPYSPQIWPIFIFLRIDSLNFFDLSRALF